MRVRLLVWGVILGTGSLFAQQPMSIKMKNPVVCYGSAENNPIVIPPPEAYLNWKINPQARIKTATIEVTYNGFSIQAQQAFQAAVDIWETLISSPVTIKIEAHWTNLGPGVLGSAIYTAANANFPGAQKLNVFYPVAIAEKITGENLNEDDPDIFAQFSSSANWHFNPGTTPPPNTYDLVTVVLHEIGHGLGFASTFDVTGSNGLYGLNDTEVPIVFDVPIQNGSSQNLIASFPSPSTDLKTQLTSSALFFNSHTSANAKLYAPSTFDDGSSISHLDDATFDNPGNNALMTHSIALQERIHDPGIALNILKDLGWEIVKINHQQFAGSESISGPYAITAVIEGENGYNSGSVKLNYTLNGTTFTQVTMTPTGNAHEFTANIPSTGSADEYGYFISVNDNAGREFLNPGKIVRKNDSQLQYFFSFTTGPDTEAPKIAHAPKPFITEADLELEIEAKITDNLGIQSTAVEYYKNDVLQGTIPLVLADPEEDSIYTATINLVVLNLASGDEIKYRISATDVAVIGTPGGNIGYSPSASTFHLLNVVGLEPTEDSYVNNFNSPSDDFFGSGFSITTPAGFTDAAIHTTHPYAEGDPFPDDELNLIYQLKIPIRVQSEGATITFDEIVLVEPGDAGSVFGEQDFFDYVVVEGSTDGGITWIPVANGYDSRNNSAWLTRYNSALNTTTQLSSAVGDPTLFRTRSLNLLDEFEEGDEVVIRFRLFSDQLAAGWGWCIDNLKIQVDETPPLVLHSHVDYLFDSDDVISLNSKVSDASGIKAYRFEYFVNSGSIETQVFDVDPPQSQYLFSLTGLSALSVGDVINYRFVALDSADVEGTFPPAGFIQVPIIEFGTPVSTYSNNFNSASTDFVGNFFTIEQPSGFANSAIHSTHFYNNGLGLDRTSNFVYTLKKPIKISNANTYLRFDEIVLVEGHSGSPAPGTPAFKDYVVVEGSKDGGTTWHALLTGYDIVGQPAWVSAFNLQSNGTPALFRTRSIDLTESGDFITNDNVIIRFRMFVDETINGWGWAIDNLYVQDPITGTEKELDGAVHVYPNPAKGNITVEADGVSSSYFTIQLIDTQGKNMYRATGEISNGKMSHTIATNNLSPGLYIMKIMNEGKTVVRKIVKTD
jgi:hypothetical protein